MTEEMPSLLWMETLTAIPCSRSRTEITKFHLENKQVHGHGLSLSRFQNSNFTLQIAFSFCFVISCFIPEEPQVPSAFHTLDEAVI